MLRQNKTSNTSTVRSRFINGALGLFLFIFCFTSEAAVAQIQASFSIDAAQGCVPLTVHCTNTSTGGVTHLSWTTSDGQTSTDNKPTFVFTKPGRFRISLTSSNYTTSSYTYRDVVVNGIPPFFTYQYSNICSAPVPVQFHVYDTSAAGNYHWSFGDSTVSIETNPAHTYTRQGTYQVQVVTYSKEGCVDSIVQPLQTGQVVVDFTSPVSVCSNSAVWFASASSAVPKYAKWTVNGTVVSTSVAGFSYSFLNPGTYTILLTQDFGGCTFSKEKTITVLQKPMAAFTQTGTLKSCIFPSQVQFQNASQYADAYTWNFGDSATSTDANPSHTYSVAGQFSPTLIASNANGCADTLVKQNLVLLGPPIIYGFKNLQTYKCLPFTLQTGAFLSSPEAIASYNWNWGDGNGSSDSMPSYTYTRQGTYAVSLIVKTVSGCTSSFVLKNAVFVGDSVVPSFTVDKSILCSSDSVHFSVGASKSGSYNWLWIFGDNTLSTIPNVTHQYSTTGYKTVVLQLTNNGCSVQTSKKNVLLVKPPVAKIAVAYDCKNQLQVSFRDTSQGALSWRWNFGDGSTSVAQYPPTHVYSASGIYTVKLATTNGECADADTLRVAILNTKPIFTFSSISTTLCRKQGIWMSATNPEYIADYYWNFDDGRSAFSDTSIYNFYSQPGTYRPSLITKYKNGCYDTIISPSPVVINGPTASFNTAAGSSCLGATTNFVDNSKSDGTHKIVSWWWSCGDGFAAKLDSPYFSHRYAGSANYAATLVITDNNNCADTAYFTVKINALPTLAAVKDTFVCDGSSITLKVGGASSYAWNDDATLSCSNCDAPVASPQEVAHDYEVTGTDANNCKASDTVHVQVVRPFNLSVSSSASEICQEQNVTLTAVGGNLYSWQPATGLNDATLANPIATPNITTQYFVTATDAHHCFSQRGDITIQVHPKPKFAIQDSLFIAQKGDVHSIATTGSSNITSWLWTPAYGLSCSDCAQPVLTAVKTTTYTGIVYTDDGCSDTAKLIVHVLCNQSKIEIPTGFTPNRDGRNDWFYVMSSIDNPIRSMIIYSRNGDRVFAKTNFVTNNPTQGWDGNYNGIPMPGGVYVYRIEVMCNDQVVPLTGTITLLR